MSDETLKVEKTPAELEKERIQAEADLGAWYAKSKQLAELKEEEMALRNKVVRYYFPDGLKEGTNKVELPEGWKLTVQGTINRKVLVEELVHVKQELKEKFQIDAGELLKYKPEIDLPQYRQLVKNVKESIPSELERHKAILQTFEQMLEISDGSPQVKLEAPKKKAVKVSVI